MTEEELVFEAQAIGRSALSSADRSCYHVHVAIVSYNDND